MQHESIQLWPSPEQLAVHSAYSNLLHRFSSPSGLAFPMLRVGLAIAMPAERIVMMVENFMFKMEEDEWLRTILILLMLRGRVSPKLPPLRC